MAVQKWNEERTQELINLAGSESPVSNATVQSIAAALETTTRSISSKLRKMDYDVESSTAARKPTFSEAQESALNDFVTGNSGAMTYGEIAEGFDGGSFSPKQIQGKILSMELTSHVKPTPKKETPRTYTTAEEETFLKMVSEGAFIEDIASALGKDPRSIRGKALSFLRAGSIEAIPKQKASTAADKKDELEALGDVSAMTVEDIAAALEKTPRGIRTMLTRRGLVASDYDGAAKKAKLVEA